MLLGYRGEIMKKRLGDGGYIQENWDTSYPEDWDRVQLVGGEGQG